LSRCQVCCQEHTFALSGGRRWTPQLRLSPCDPLQLEKTTLSKVLDRQFNPCYVPSGSWGPVLV
jgi:hypothetical protein